MIVLIAVLLLIVLLLCYLSCTNKNAFFSEKIAVKFKSINYLRRVWKPLYKSHRRPRDCLICIKT